MCMSVIVTPALREQLQQSGNVSCVVDEGLRLVYCNPAWDQFALANDGDAALASRVLGRNVLDVVPQPLKRLYDQLFGVARDTRQMWPLDYECSSPDVYRLFRMEIRPIQSGTGFVLVHALRVEHPHDTDRKRFSADADRYANTQGVITMCAHCRKTRRVADLEIWDWVPEYLNPGTMRTRITHGLCGSCLAYFYPNAWKATAIGG